MPKKVQSSRDVDEKQQESYRPQHNDNIHTHHQHVCGCDDCNEYTFGHDGRCVGGNRDNKCQNHALNGRRPGHASKARSTQLQTSNRFEVLGADMIVNRNHQEGSLERDPDKNQDETETGCTRVTKKCSSRLSDTQLTQTMQLQFLESGIGEEIVNGLGEGWMRVSRIMDSGVAVNVGPRKPNRLRRTIEK